MCRLTSNSWTKFASHFLHWIHSTVWSFCMWIFNICMDRRCYLHKWHWYWRWPQLFSWTFFCIFGCVSSLAFGTLEWELVVVCCVQMLIHFNLLNDWFHANFTFDRFSLATHFVCLFIFPSGQSWTTFRTSVRQCIDLSHWMCLELSGGSERFETNLTLEWHCSAVNPIRKCVIKWDFSTDFVSANIAFKST